MNINRMKAEEHEQELRNERIKEGVLWDIDNDGDATSEAVGTQATLSRLDRGNNWNISQELKELLTKAIEKPSDEADQALGKYFRETAYEYIAKSVEDLI
jgi:hypothetical protein